MTPEPKYLTKSNAGVGTFQDRLARIGDSVPAREVTRMTKMAAIRRLWSLSGPRDTLPHESSDMMQGSDGSLRRGVVKVEGWSMSITDSDGGVQV